MRPSIHALLSELDELRSWMLENGVYHAKAGDLELNIDPDTLIAERPVHGFQTPPQQLPAEEIERPAYRSIYDDPDLYAAVGGDPIKTDEQAGDSDAE